MNKYQFEEMLKANPIAYCIEMNNKTRKVKYFTKFNNEKVYFIVPFVDFEKHNFSDDKELVSNLKEYLYLKQRPGEFLRINRD